MKRFVITGTGRSGTKWCATILRLAGIQCGHEQVFKTEQLPEFGSQEWGDFEGDSSLAAAPFLPRCPDSRKVLVVRHPLSVAASFIHNGSFLQNGHPEGLLQYLRERHPEITTASTELEAALRYWTVWNQRALDVDIDVVLRLEELTPERLLDAVECKPRWSLFPFDQPVNATTPPVLSSDSIAAYPPARELAAILGYGDL